MTMTISEEELLILLAKKEIAIFLLNKEIDNLKKLAEDNNKK